MDNVLVDFPSAFERIPKETYKQYEDNLDEVPGIFSMMDPIPGALEAYAQLAAVFDTYLLSTAPWENPSAWSDKLLWVKKHVGTHAHKRLILSHNKHLNHGHYLVDDRTANGAGRFPGEHLHFATEAFPDWASVLDYLLPNTDC